MATSTLEWQKKLLTFMQASIIILSAFYLIASIYQFSSLSERIEKPTNASINRFLGTYNIDSAFSNSLSKDERMWLAQCFFEAYITETRQRNAESLLLSRTWIKYLGFVTGMVLCIVGAVFVLGKLTDENQSMLEGGTGSSKFSLKSHSPGIIMAVLGTTLILATILTHQVIEKTDASVYFRGSAKLTPNEVNMIVDEIADSIKNQNADTTVQPPEGF